MSIEDARQRAREISKQGKKSQDKAVEQVSQGPKKGRIDLLFKFLGLGLLGALVAGLIVTQRPSGTKERQEESGERRVLEILPSFDVEPIASIEPAKPQAVKSTSVGYVAAPADTKQVVPPKEFRPARYEPPKLSSGEVPAPVAAYDPGLEAARGSSIFVDLDKAGDGVSSMAVPIQYKPEGAAAMSVEDLQKASGGSRSGDANVDFYKNQGEGVSVQLINDRTVAQGTMITAVLISNINSDLPGPILARVTSNVYDSLTGKNLLIPQNSVLIAEYNSSIGWGQERVQIGWRRIQRPDGFVVNLGNMPGVDRTGAAGVQAQVDGHFWDYMGALGFMIGTQLTINELQYQTSMAKIAGVRQLGGTVTEAVSPSVNQLGNAYLNKTMTRPATLRVPQSVVMSVFVLADIQLPVIGGK